MGPVYVGRPAGAWAHKPRFDDIKDLEKRVVDRGNGKGRIAEAGKSSAVWRGQRAAVSAETRKAAGEGGACTTLGPAEGANEQL